MLRPFLGVAVGAGLFLALLYFGFHWMQTAPFEYSTWMGVAFMVVCFFLSVALARWVSGGAHKSSP